MVLRNGLRPRGTDGVGEGGHGLWLVSSPLSLGYCLLTLSVAGEVGCLLIKTLTSEALLSRFVAFLCHRSAGSRIENPVNVFVPEI